MKEIFLLLFLFGILLIQLFNFSKTKKPSENKEEKQDDFSKTMLSIVITISVAAFACSEIFWGLIKKLYIAQSPIIPIVVLLIVFSVFCFATALWISNKETTKNSEIIKRKFRWNTAGTIFFFFAIFVSVLFLLVKWSS